MFLPLSREKLEFPAFHLYLWINQIFNSPFQQLYNTYTPSSYGNLEPTSISYALVAPNCYGGPQQAIGTVIRPASSFNPPPQMVASSQNLRKCTATPPDHRGSFLNRPFLVTISGASVNTLAFHPQHHLLIPSAPQTLNRQMYHFTSNPPVVTVTPPIPPTTTAPADSSKYLYGWLKLIVIERIEYIF